MNENEEMLFNKTAMPSYKALVAQYGTPISTKDYQSLRTYANDRSIRLSDFKDYVGDIGTIKTVIDDICEIAADFPLMLDVKKGVVLKLDYGLGSDFATTESGHIIHLNAVYFGDINRLEKEYNESVRQRRFVQGTDWRAIGRHEAGHIVSYLYHINPMSIALRIKQGMRETNVLDVLTDELSIYSTEYLDGREIISESFSAYYSKVDNEFANSFVHCCLEIAQKDR